MESGAKPPEMDIIYKKYLCNPIKDLNLKFNKIGASRRKGEDKICINLHPKFVVAKHTNHT